MAYVSSLAKVPRNEAVGLLRVSRGQTSLVLMAVHKPTLGPSYPVRADPGVAPATGLANPPPGEPWSSYPSAIPPGRRASQWTAGRVAALVAGSLLCVGSLGLIATGGIALAADQALRDGDGYLTTPSQQLDTSTYALTTDPVVLRDVAGPDELYVQNLLGTLRIRVTQDRPPGEVFVGIARSADALHYLTGTRYATIVDFGDGGISYVEFAGAAPSSLPGSQDFWVASARGTGTQTLVWPVRSGDWRLVVMNASGTAGVGVTADIGATVPSLTTIAVVILIIGLVLLAVGVALSYVAVRRAPRPRPATYPPSP